MTKRKKTAPADSEKPNNPETAAAEQQSDASESAVTEKTSDAKIAEEKPTEKAAAKPAEKAEPKAKPDANKKASEKATSEQPKPAAAENKESEQGATWPGKLALLLSVAALGVSGYLYYQSLQNTQQQQQTLSSIGTLKQDIASAVETATAAASKAESEVGRQVSAINSQLQAAKADAAKQSAEVTELQERLTRSIQQVEASTQQSNSRKDWLLAEVEYLLRLANQRVLMENSPTGALALMKSADKILQQTDDVSIFAVRKSLASDIASLEAVPTIDQQGSYLKLAAMSEQIDNLRMVPLTDKNKLPSLIDDVTADSISESLQQDIKESWANAVAKVEKLVVVQHRDEKIEPLLSPTQHYYLRQNLRLMMEQAQLALLQKQQSVFDESLAKAHKWIGDYFQADDATTLALLKGLKSLEGLKIDPAMPDISNSLTTLKRYLQQAADLKAKGGA